MPPEMTHHRASSNEFNTPARAVFTAAGGGAGACSARIEVTAARGAHLKTCRDALVPLLQQLPGVELAPAKGGMYAFFSWTVSTIRWCWPSGWWRRPGSGWRRGMLLRRKRKDG
jgi:aspartate/methionine/tyrosine aminotransferase